MNFIINNPLKNKFYNLSQLYSCNAPFRKKYDYCDIIFDKFKFWKRQVMLNLWGISSESLLVFEKLVDDLISLTSLTSKMGIYIGLATPRLKDTERWDLDNAINAFFDLLVEKCKVNNEKTFDDRMIEVLTTSYFLSWDRKFHFYISLWQSLDQDEVNNEIIYKQYKVHEYLQKSNIQNWEFIIPKDYFL